MPKTWTDKMGKISAKPAHEDVTRAAVIAACDFMDKLSPGAEKPRWNGSTYLVPRNDTAKQMAAAILAQIPGAPPLTGIERETIVSTAVASAFHSHKNGGSDKGWGALEARLEAQHKAGSRGRKPNR